MTKKVARALYRASTSSTAGVITGIGAVVEAQGHALARRRGPWVMVG